jgi:hypothetical protein
VKARQSVIKNVESLISVARVLSKVEEVEDGMNSTNKASTVKISRQSDINDDTQQEVAYLVVFCFTDMGKATDTFHK